MCERERFVLPTTNTIIAVDRLPSNTLSLYCVGFARFGRSPYQPTVTWTFFDEDIDYGLQSTPHKISHQQYVSRSEELPYDALVTNSTLVFENVSIPFHHGIYGCRVDNGTKVEDRYFFLAQSGMSQRFDISLCTLKISLM